jgi:hypothetical protein
LQSFLKDLSYVLEVIVRKPNIDYMFFQSISLVYRIQ